MITLDTLKRDAPLRAVVFDFGGVLADEGFRLGLRVIGRDNGLDPERTFETGRRLVSETGYLTGEAPEEAFWNAFRRETGLDVPDRALRREILERFAVRPWMLEHVRSLGGNGCLTAILSDQTNWLEEINLRQPFFHIFHVVQNSYVCGKTKHEDAAFSGILDRLGITPAEALFVDDTLEHVRRARSLGMGAIHYISRSAFENALKGYMAGRLRSSLF